MPKILEDLLWCAALATWLMLLCGFVVAAMQPFAENLRRQLKARLKSKERQG
ncbi:hypothetical protein JQ596_39190 [Bradyrhizobium manausense]|uniref:hypothetical protein n=1 Tax=Bradyrhizobium TaxID=374 RepID=UPI001BADD282|nr:MULTISPECIES: hypothetical protein [Bradyrhizobium]MBR0831545.1 hypothetical protein [Bradyrhizobium manausense]UVO27052.1 hypothetical protein KUF59_31640 [Bradyrhizobium arachidis]